MYPHIRLLSQNPARWVIYKFHLLCSVAMVYGRFPNYVTLIICSNIHFQKEISHTERLYFLFQINNLTQAFINCRVQIVPKRWISRSTANKNLFLAYNKINLTYLFSFIHLREHKCISNPVSIWQQSWFRTTQEYK